MFGKNKNSQNKEGATVQKNHQSSQIEKKCEEYKNDLRRLAAEFDNYKKRTEKQMQISRQLGSEDVLIHLLTIQDEFSQALEHSKTNEDAKEGLSLLSKKILATLSSFNVGEIECNGDANPNLHEVMLTVPGKNKGEICRVLRKGYRIGERLLRPAQVSVYSGEENGNDKKEKTNQSSGSETGDKGENEN